jgi:hypothetical protein
MTVYARMFFCYSLTCGASFPEWIAAPPSTMICCPVICAEAGEQRKRASPAISCGVPTRPTLAMSSDGNIEGNRGRACRLEGCQFIAVLFQPISGHLAWEYTSFYMSCVSKDSTHFLLPRKYCVDPINDVINPLR